MRDERFDGGPIRFCLLMPTDLLTYFYYYN